MKNTNESLGNVEPIDRTDLRVEEVVELHLGKVQVVADRLYANLLHEVEAATPDHVGVNGRRGWST